MTEIAVSVLNNYRIQASRDALKFSRDAEHHWLSHQYRNAAFWAVASLEEAGRAILCTQWISMSHPETRRVHIPSKIWNAVLYANAEDGHKIRLGAVQAGTALLMRRFIAPVKSGKNIPAAIKLRIRDILKEYPPVRQISVLWMNRFLEGSVVGHSSRYSGLRHGISRRALGNANTADSHVSIGPAEHLPALASHGLAELPTLRAKVRAYVGLALLVSNLLSGEETLG
jgi:hypothetical protein